MNILEQLASAQGRRDEAPNLALAGRIASEDDNGAVNELMAGLELRNKAIQSDCIKVLYEIGELRPELIAGHFDGFLALLHSKNNRLQWGAMTALRYIADVRPQTVYKQLPAILAAAEKGSVITRDKAVGILISLAGRAQYTATVFALLLEQLAGCPVNQLAMYAEQALPVVDETNKAAFASALRSRLEDIDKASKRARIEKVLRKLA